MSNVIGGLLPIAHMPSQVAKPEDGGEEWRAGDNDDDDEEEWEEA